MSDLGVQIQQAVNEAIERVVREHEGGFTLRWAAILETAAPDGTRGAWTLTSPDITPWDVLGLLDYGLQIQNAQILKGAI